MMLWRDRSLLFKTIFDSTFFSFVYLSSQFFSQAFFCFQCKLVQFSLFFFDTKFLLFPDWQEPREESVDTHKRNECLNEWMKKEKDVMKGKSCRHRCTFLRRNRKVGKKGSQWQLVLNTEFHLILLCVMCVSRYISLSATKAEMRRSRLLLLRTNWHQTRDEIWDDQRRWQQDCRYDVHRVQELLMSEGYRSEGCLWLNLQQKCPCLLCWLCSVHAFLSQRLWSESWRLQLNQRSLLHLLRKRIRNALHSFSAWTCWLAKLMMPPMNGEITFWIVYLVMKMIYYFTPLSVCVVTGCS